eukprot:CAMPEP_0116571618 /NCGR_PEP_ID=MMETSP0397-20121206/17672_1 /TAXON_ID=216820 /ORGANISM="Cyclophora tenuis, Strain ECT3854" /LENGTH=173 /DNA_ID=CAMNT_0004099759 /DNA_START=64 /DNA_END=586 /DNA_ORIENTATION=-
MTDCSPTITTSCIAITVPKEFDILIGRGRSAIHHNGNRRFRIFLQRYLPRYVSAKSTTDRDQVANFIVSVIHEAGGRFLKQDPKTQKWHPVDAAMSRQKVRSSFDELMVLQERDRRTATTASVNATRATSASSLSLRASSSSLRASSSSSSSSLEPPKTEYNNGSDDNRNVVD